MNRILDRLAIGLAVAGIFALLLGGVCHVAGLRINMSGSIPEGIYRITEKPVAKGAYVIFCPPPADVFAMARQRYYISYGYCPGRYGYMMKMVAADAGDTVTVNKEGVLVNGRLLRRSRPRAVDLAGRSLPVYRVSRHILGKSELLLMSDADDLGFDARYFGPINRTQIRAVIRPVVTVPW